MQVIIKNKRTHVEDIRTFTFEHRIWMLIGGEVMDFVYGETCYFIINWR